jgi:hypothetical protein
VNFWSSGLGGHCGLYSDSNIPDELAVSMSLDYTEEGDRNVPRKDGI